MDSQQKSIYFYIDQSIVRVIRKEPFYGHILGNVTRRVESTIPTAAVSLNQSGISLLVNPDFFIKELNSEERCAVLKHEILHLVFKHLFRINEKITNHFIFNIAADLVVNQFVKPWPLPNSAYTLDKFSDLNLKPNKSLEYYYTKLIEDKNDSPLKYENIYKNISHSYHGYWASQGGEGSNKSDDIETKNADNILSKKLCQIHEDSFNRILKSAKERISDKEWGSLPGSVRDSLDIEKSNKISNVNWKRCLRIFVSAGFKTRLITSKRKRSKRFPLNPGIRVKRDKHISIIIDTSASIDNDTMSLFFNEIRSIWKTGVSILIIESDAKVGKVYTYQGKTPDIISGGGGTNFDPAFDWIKENSRKKYDGCIYLTDGFAPSPTIEPPCRVLWAISPTGKGGEHLKFGRQLIIKCN